MTQVSATGAAPDCVALERVQPESVPLGACAVFDGMREYRYDDRGRIVESPSGTYSYAGNVATLTGAEETSTREFDAAHRLVRLDDTRFLYDADGRIASEASGEMVIVYEYGPDDTYSTRHNAPDTDEFCVSDRVEVVHDAEGRPVLDRYDGCQINEPLRTLRYVYEGERIVRAEVDTGSDGTVDRVLTMQYDCSATPTP